MTASVPLDGEPELPPRPAAIRFAATAVGLAAAVVSGASARLLAPTGGAAQPVTWAEIAAAFVLAAVIGGPIALVAVQLWRGATLAYAIVVAACGLTGLGVVWACLFPPVIAYALGRPVPDGFEVLLGTPGRTSFTIAAVLALTALICLRTSRSRDWVALMYRYRIDSGIRNRVSPAKGDPL